MPMASGDCPTASSSLPITRSSQKSPVSSTLAIYLIVIGLSTIAALAISGVITGVLALAAGIFILIRR